MGYRIDIDHAGCINCGICMDVCPVEALDMSRPAAPGHRDRPGRGAADAVDDGAPRSGRRVHRLPDLRQASARSSVITLATQRRPDAARRRARARSIVPPTRTGGLVGPLARSPASRSSQTHPSPWGDLFQWRRERARRGSARTGCCRSRRARRRSRHARRPVRPAPTRAATSGWSPRGRYDDAYAVAAEVNPFPSVCGWICTAPCEAACRRGVLDEPIAIRTLKRFAAEHGTLPPVAAPARDAGGSRRDRRRRAGRACRPPTTSPASATRSRSSRRCRCPAA